MTEANNNNIPSLMD
jgi:hypothetical protein